MKEVGLREELFEGTISLRRGEGWLQAVRLPVEEIPLHEENFVRMALTSCGCRLRFTTDSGSLVLEVEPDGEAARLFDLTTDDELLAAVELPAGGSIVRFQDLPPGRVLELWLPVFPEVKLRRLSIDDGTTLEPSPDRRPRWITYGSSITHCGAAHSPSRTWPATAARMRGLNLTSLGYSGQCHLDPLVAMMIRDRSADLISLKVGINMHGGSVSPRTFRPLLIGMVRIIREKQPTTPIAVVSPIISPPREETPGQTGLTLQMMRSELELAVSSLRACGDANVHYFNGLDVLGQDMVEAYLPDLLHPNGDGYEAMGRNFAAKVLDRIALK